MEKYIKMLSDGLGLSTIAIYRFIEDIGGIVNDTDLVDKLKINRFYVTKLRYHLNKLYKAGYLQKVKQQNGRVLYLCK
jgi:Mn-dependent DtxR family transcriptional regulator